ncbi:HDOD domain-containing protein [Hydrogenovibrio halophilus]|uniref:HDOD domain-containing protein n=1 Tax=Hydrogenovibrio halophilus TaxID=373391 RepID=UPI0009FF6BED|nr:HDOD domain-containing protein [Hydrogenovibrio halophilus]
MHLPMKAGIENATRILKQTPMTAVPPEIYELESLMQQEAPNAHDVADLLARNPEILGEFLSLTNRVLNRPEDDLILNAMAAVNLLGLDEIHHLFLSTYLQKHLPVSLADRKLIAHDLRAGLAAAELSYWVGGIGRTQAYLYAFMQNIGALVMLRHDPEAYGERFLNPQMNQPVSAHQSEIAHYQTAHTFVGSIIARRWHLGDALSKTLLFHHQPDLIELEDYNPSVAKMVALIHIANYLVFQHFSDHFMVRELEKLYEEAVHYLALPDNAISAAEAALEKWGHSGHLPDAAH